MGRVRPYFLLKALLLASLLAAQGSAAFSQIPPPPPIPQLPVVPTVPVPQLPVVPPIPIPQPPVVPPVPIPQLPVPPVPQPPVPPAPVPQLPGVPGLPNPQPGVAPPVQNPKLPVPPPVGLPGLSGAETPSSATGSTGLTNSTALGGDGPAVWGKRFLAARHLLNWTAILGVSQPSLAILVDAVNDANGDGIFSDKEIASKPGADVTFKALVTNIGAVNFEIATVTHSYNGGMGAAPGEVCGELVGIMLAPGESLACAFPAAGYSPARGESLVNTVTAAGFEVGKGARRGASDSDTSAVDTLLAGDEVLAVAIKRNLAFTGTDAARLAALALVLLAAGGGFLSLARTRSRRLAMPLPSESPVNMLGWWAAGPAPTHSRWKVGRR